MAPSTIMGINKLNPNEKREVYSRLIPSSLISRFHLEPSLINGNGSDLLSIHGNPRSPSVEISLHHRADFPDPILYGHLTDTLNGQIHILLYILNDPESPRFDVDRMPDGRRTVFGTRFRNQDAEIAAMQAGLAPGQIRRGLRMLSEAIIGFEKFIYSLGQVLYFVEPLYYHNAIIFERYGFTYQKGRKFMEHIQAGFLPGGDFLKRLDRTTPFRQPEAANSIRLRSWAIHDGIFGDPYGNVTMYKHIGKNAGIQTCPDIPW